MAEKARATYFTVGKTSGKVSRDYSITGGNTIKVISGATLRNALREANKELRGTPDPKPKRAAVE